MITIRSTLTLLTAITGVAVAVAGRLLGVHRLQVHFTSQRIKAANFELHVLVFVLAQSLANGNVVKTE